MWEARTSPAQGRSALHKGPGRGEVPVTLKEYDDVEHLLIVREAAADVFKFFDGAARK